MNIELSKEQVESVLTGLSIAGKQIEYQEGKEEMRLIHEEIYNQLYNAVSIPCPHTVMIATGKGPYSWKCSKCGAKVVMIFGKK